MAKMEMTRDFFLWSTAVIYLFAFASLFVQIPGLYGDNGLLPARLVLQKEPHSWEDFLTQPTIIRLLPKLGLDIATSLDAVCLAGVVLAFVAMVSRAQRNTLVFSALWAFYFSLFQVGQTFLWFQWDILLLETGFLTILIAPWNGLGSNLKVKHHHHDSITMWLLKWLLFRLMFASGVVKLTSMCPTWWGLTALDYHYETQCIPTPLAWYAHQLPSWFQRLSVVGVYVIEIAVPFLYFSPVRAQRRFAFYCQILFMMFIIITGNYNFFNLLTMALSLSLIDDDFLESCIGKSIYRKSTHTPSILGKFLRPVKWTINLLVFGGLIYTTVLLFNLQVTTSPFRITSRIEFKEKDLQNFLLISLPVSIWIGVVSLTWEVIRSFVRAFLDAKGVFRKVTNSLGCVLFAVVAFFMFAISLVPHTYVHQESHSSLPSAVHKFYGLSQPLRITSPYGLFKRMTGVGGRPEVIIEGSNSVNGPWLEYEFQYKPSNLSTVLPLVAPHQPRLDWQMWFAALGSYHQNNWFVNLMYRLFENRKEVLDLMGKNPFKNKPPKFLKATLYNYHFTKWSEVSYKNNDWWVRKFKKEYFPIISKDEPNFVQYLTSANIYEDTKKSKSKEVTWKSPLWYLLHYLRKIVGQPEGCYTCMGLFITGLVLTFLDPTLKLLQDNWILKHA